MGCTTQAPAPSAEPPSEAVVLPEPVTLPASPAPSRPALQAPRAPAVRLASLLDQAELSLALAYPTHTAALPLPDWSTDKPGRHVHRSPVRFDHREYRSSPPTAALLNATGEAVPYAPRLVEDNRCQRGVQTCWEVEQDTLYVRSAVPPTAEWRLSHGTALSEARRISPIESGLSATDFVQWQPTIDGLTRQALLLPAPSTLTLSIDVHTDHVLRFGLGLPASRILTTADSRASLTVSIDEQVVFEHEATRGAPWTDHTIDLSPYAGRTIQLRFSTSGSLQGAPLAIAEPTLAPTNGPPPRRVVVVGLDTLRVDHVGLHGGPATLTPNLDAIGRQSIVFDDAWAPAPRTRPSFRTALTGRWPLEAIGAPPLSAVLQQQGFSTAGIVANVHLQPHLGFADGAGWWDYHDSDDADPQMERAIAWLERHAHEDTALFVHFMDSHVFYTAPEPYLDAFTDPADRGRLPDRYNRWTIAGLERDGELSDAQKRWIGGRYQGELRYLDQALGRLVQAIDALPGDTLLVLLSDHGEELWDHGGFEHNHSLHGEVMRSLLWVRPPGGWSDGPHRVSAPVSLADVAPTVFDLTGVPTAQRPRVDGTSLAAFLNPEDTAQQATLSRSLTERPLPLGHMMFNLEQWGVRHGDWLYTLTTISGQEQAYHLPTDPTEQTNRLAEAPVEALRAALSAATGWPVVQGWRIRLDEPAEPFTLVFSEPIAGAGVIPPEAARTRRANLEWGEVPPRLPDDVATVTVSPDHTRVTVTPTHHAGTLYVAGPGPTTQAKVEQDGPAYVVSAGNRVLGRSKARIVPGTLILPTEREGAALSEVGDPRLTEALRAMGYIE